ncbi:MAG: hypothetical protein K2X03_01140 [Bryobacteraceae bacterium]|nr:hypothetical protein [Bryobacteraceae bacterium]
MNSDFDHLTQRWREAGVPRLQFHQAMLASGTHFSRLTRGLVWECVGWGALVLLMGSILGSQRSLYALLCHIYAVVMLAMSIRELISARALDVAEPVAVLQRRWEEVEVLRIRRLKWAILAGTVLWAPFAIVLWQACTGIRVNVRGIWMGANLGFGLAVAGLTLWLSRRYPGAHRIWRAVSGESLAEAERALRRLREFQE